MANNDFVDLHQTVPLLKLRLFYQVYLTYYIRLSKMMIVQFFLHWYGHVERSSDAVRTACDIEVNGMCRQGRPQMQWKNLTENDCHEWKLMTVAHLEGNTWKSEP